MTSHARHSFLKASNLDFERLEVSNYCMLRSVGLLMAAITGFHACASIPFSVKVPPSY
jgi:hypothetical protein